MDQLDYKPLTAIDVVQFFWRWRKWIIGATLVAGLAGFIASMPVFMKPRFQATHIFYPTQNNSIADALLQDANQRQKDPLQFGEEEQAEQALQVLQSSALMSRLVRNFNLMKHYGIDPAKVSWPQTALQAEIDARISFSRTRYLSIRIDVLDEDPKMAAKIANGIALLYDSVKTEIQHQVAGPALEIVERNLRAKQQQIQQVRDEMRKLGEQGITNYEEQSRAIAEEIYKAQAAGQTGKLQTLLEAQRNLAANGGAWLSLNEKIRLEEEKESNINAMYEKRKIDVNEKLSHKFTVSEATVPERKAWPVRRLIVMLAMMAGFGFSAIGLLFFEFYKSRLAKAA